MSTAAVHITTSQGKAQTCLKRRPKRTLNVMAMAMLDGMDMHPEKKKITSLKDNYRKGKNN